MAERRIFSCRVGLGVGSGSNVSVVLVSRPPPPCRANFHKVVQFGSNHRNRPQCTCLGCFCRFLVSCIMLVCVRPATPQTFVNRREWPNWTDLRIIDDGFCVFSHDKCSSVFDSCFFMVFERRQSVWLDSDQGAKCGQPELSHGSPKTIKRTKVKF